MGYVEARQSDRDKKKGYRCSPTFVNLKSNTMKNTMQIYAVLGDKTNFWKKKTVNLTPFNIANCIFALFYIISVAVSLMFNVRQVTGAMKQSKLSEPD